MRRLHAALVACALGSVAMSGSPASAAAVFTFVEQGGDVVGTLSGSLDLTGLSPDDAFTNGAGILAAFGDVISSPPGGGATKGYDVTGPSAFGTGGGLATSRSGNVLHLNMFSGRLFFDASYVSGSAVSGSLVFGGTDLAGLGINPGSYVYTLRNQETFTLVFREGATTVPAPASLPLLAGALGMLGLAGALRRKG